MKPADSYLRFVKWSEEDQCYIGYCPDLFYGGICHGEGEEETYANLCSVARDEFDHRLSKDEKLAIY
jgi:predicted RNase H-like HicB family nuclease